MSPLVRAAIGGVVGAAVGFVMYRFVGCRSGACPLIGNPYIAIAIWGIMGMLITAGK